MYLKFGSDFADFDLEFLKDLFALFDSRWGDLQLHIDASSDPDPDGLCDQGEYLAGMGLISCQRYLAATYGQHQIRKDIAFAFGPTLPGGKTFAEVVNAGANYWKHCDEWDTVATIARDISLLTAQQQCTVRTIETVTPWSDYTCANLLYELSDGRDTFLDLIVKLEQWRNAMDTAQVG